MDDFTNSTQGQVADGVPATPDKPTTSKLTPKVKKTLIAAGSTAVVILVAVLIVYNFVIVPKQAAAEAAAAEQARIEQEHQAAVDAFTDAAAVCDRATQSLASEISAAQATLQTDPTTMNDPTLIDALKTAITIAQALPPCTAQEMADDTATITQQTKDLTSAATTITAGSSQVGTAASNVTASVQAKKDAEEAAQQAKLERITKGSINLTDPAGFTLNFAWTDVKVLAEVDTTVGGIGNAVVSWHMEANVTVTNTTPGKQAPGPDYINITPLWENHDDQFCSLFPELNSNWKPVCEDDYAPLYYYLISDTRYASVFGPGNGARYGACAICDTTLGVDEKHVFPTYVTTTQHIEVPAEKAQALVTALESPTALVVYYSVKDSTGGGRNQHYVNCVTSVETQYSPGAMCLLGGSDW